MCCEDVRKQVALRVAISKDVIRDLVAVEMGPSHCCEAAVFVRRERGGLHGGLGLARIGINVDRRIRVGVAMDDECHDAGSRTVRRLILSGGSA